MARTSKRKTNTKRIDVGYYAGIYVRLSKDTKKQIGYCSSIEQQIELCKQVSIQKNIYVVDVYIDYEYTGTNLIRPAFCRLMEDIQAKKINCILLKDLSRLGRTYVEVGQCIDQLFPLLGVRFISVSDRFDSLYVSNEQELFSLLIKNLCNDFYSKDISKKAKASKEIQASERWYTGTKAPYGYHTIRVGKKLQLAIDPKTAPIVKRIFLLYKNGFSTGYIAQLLNQKRLSTRAVYYQTKELYVGTSTKQWRAKKIATILRNEVYKGTVITFKFRNLYVEEKFKTIPQPKEAWVIQENVHEKIVSEDLFNAVQIRLDEQNVCDQMKTTKPRSMNKYKGMVVDGRTKQTMTRIRKRPTDQYVFVSRYDSGMINHFPMIEVNETAIDEAVTTMFKQTYAPIVERLNKTQLIQQLDDQLIELEEKITKCYQTLETLYEQYLCEIINEIQYKEEKRTYLTLLDDLKQHKQTVALQKNRKQYEVQKERILYEDLLHCETINHYFIQTYVENIIVWSKDQINVRLKAWCI